MQQMSQACRLWLCALPPVFLIGSVELYCNPNCIAAYYQTYVFGSLTSGSSKDLTVQDAPGRFSEYSVRL
jgi:hypothetical protein